MWLLGSWLVCTLLAADSQTKSGAALSLRLILDPPRVDLGEPFRLGLTVTNRGSSDASAIFFFDNQYASLRWLGDNGGVFSTPFQNSSADYFPETVAKSLATL